MAREFQEEKMNVGEGWWPIVDEMHKDLTRLLGEYELQQIKEKFGGLRYYMQVGSGCNPALMGQVRDIITAGEDKSTETCETCGQEGTNQSIGGWYKTLCPGHAEARKIAVARRMSDRDRPPQPFDPFF